MSWAFIQRAPGGTFGSDVGANSGGTGISQSSGAFGSPAAVGNHVVVWAFGGVTTLTTATCTDNAATPNTYTRVAFNNSNGKWGAVFVAPVLSNPASGNLNPTVTIGATDNSDSAVCAAEFSGGGTTTDQAAVGTGGTTGAPAPGTMTTTNADCLVLACMANASGANPTTVTTPAGFTNAGCENNGAGFDVGQGVYQVLSGTGTTNPAWDSGAVSWQAIQVALLPFAPTTDRVSWAAPLRRPGAGCSAPFRPGLAR
jgi:hypothetical protein